MAKYFECTNADNKVIIDDQRARYVKKREISANSLEIVGLGEYSYGIENTRPKFLNGIPNKNRFVNVCRLTCPVENDEIFIAISTDLYSDSIGYIVRQRIKDSNNAYIYVACSVEASNHSMSTILAHLKVAVFTDIVEDDGNIGLQIFDKDNNIIFNSSHDVMAIKNFVFKSNMNGTRTDDCYMNNSITRNYVIPSQKLCDFTDGDYCVIQNVPGAAYEYQEYYGCAQFPMTGYIAFTGYSIEINYFVGRVLIYVTNATFGADPENIKGDTSNRPFYNAYCDIVSLFSIR